MFTQLAIHETCPTLAYKCRKFGLDMKHLHSTVVI